MCKKNYNRTSEEFAKQILPRFMPQCTVSLIFDKTTKNIYTSTRRMNES